MTTTSQGAEAETLAAQHLSQNGLRIVARNWRCRLGELDLVALDQQTLVVVEVRLRKHAQFGSAAASIDARKQRKLCLAANAFLGRHKAYQHLPLRFDVIAFDGPAHSAKVTWLRGAFDCTDFNF